MRGALRDGVEQRQVLARPGPLGELHVVDDHAGARAAQAVDGPRVERAAERPLDAHVGDRGVVDRDEGDAVDGLLPAQLVAQGDRVLLLRGEDVADVGGERDRGGGEACREDGDAGRRAAPPRCGPPAHASYRRCLAK